MRIANQWNDYRILDTSGQEKLEQWGNVTLIRPDPRLSGKPRKNTGCGIMQTGIITARMLAAAAGIFPETAGIVEHSIYTAGFEISDSADQL